jgi:phospholipid N-methyltransferase
MNIDEIAPLEYARLIAIGPEAGGTTTAKLLMHMLKEENLVHIDYEDFKRTIRNALKKGFKHTGTINAMAIKFDYTLPDDLLNKYLDSQLQWENLLKRMYPSLNITGGTT